MRGGAGPSLSPVWLDLQRTSEKEAGGKALQRRPGACHAALKTIKSTRTHQCVQLSPIQSFSVLA